MRDAFLQLYRPIATASYPDGSPAASISCKDEYTPEQVRAGCHGKLTVRVADHSVSPWEWCTIEPRARTLAEAKDLAVRCLAANPHMWPKAR